MSQSILVADDDDILLGFICTVLKKAGYVVYEAAGGTKAVALFRTVGASFTCINCASCAAALGSDFQRARPAARSRS